MVPKDLRYSKEHEWVKIDGDEAVIGITDHAQDQLGDVVYVELPAVGTRVEQAKTFGVVESVKAASDLYAPMSGEVIDVNPELAKAPEKVNETPYEGGWMIRVKISNPADADALMDAAAYEEFIANG